ncbi:hypothetical protein C3747_25g56 [Trypanosoma cruzi]|uniref:Uncharacterized protein n=2 Tax=Trypanosoma cruzi TaxID=5693 RepID=Q4D0U3_TRYCC|nr:hypothetical protein, conserved [Trypanosoma cruzi]EAN86144.1 hypothetical protein, conserved [Trypanosoma cruzi]PWV16041.1 hypothetical protein C3747_25g56 [Trypanosoma cruzi]RNC45963.1 hypothetical protein TcCL_NonESM04289 [Trypanosoma cruzi]|eukprot:XP_807995.1 hypothetical protein [Trypanosoma cruzi strain CL Brener]
MHQKKRFFETFALEVEDKDVNAITSQLEKKGGCGTLSPDSGKHKKLNTTSSFTGGTHVSSPFMQQNDSNVIEPLRMLHNCIRHFASHPETYGSNLHALVDREICHVMRVKASEAALLTPGMVPVASYPLPAINNTKARNNKYQHSAMNKCASLMFCPRSIEDAVSAGTVAGVDGMFGFGATTFVEGTPGFFSLLDRASRLRTLHEEPNALEIADTAGDVSALASSATDLVTLGKDSSLQDGTPQQESTRVRFVAFSDGFSGNTPSSSALRTGAGPKLLVDGTSYEVSFLRSQLQQVEAAYNAKCISHHELQQENAQLKSELSKTEKKLQQYTTKNQEMRVQLESLKRELDAWKQRSSEFNLAGHAGNSHTSSEGSRRVQAMQLGHAKRELSHMSRLWRETEKSLQETKRTLESAEKETQLSHRYLDDAFFLIERLERRVLRRDHYIEIQQRRQSSLEEKYEKLMWCFEELRTMNGGSSYVDFLLSQDNGWSLFLFVRLQRRSMGYAQMEEPFPANPGPLFFRRTPFGGRFCDMYSPNLVLKLVTDYTQRKLGNTEGMTEMAWGVSIPRWRGNYIIDYTPPSVGGNGEGINTENVMTSWEGLYRSFPVLSLASVLLPQPSTALTGNVPIEEDIPNSAQYDQATIRLIIYCFWSERLLQYKKEMERRVRVFKSSRREPNSGQLQGEAKGEGDVTDRPIYPSTFLAALVDFVQRTFPLNTKVAEENAEEETKRLVVRGVVGKNEKAVDSVRMLFSTIFYIMKDGKEVHVVLSSQARELLFSLYYYAEEYKEVDADFRLFYLIAHQQVPELVAINFWASLEALRKDCEELLCHHIGPSSSFRSSLSKMHDSDTAFCKKTPQEELIHDTPFNALKRAVEVIDTAPLVEQSTSIEPDSDGEGYGLILPGSNVSSSEKTSSHDRAAESARSDFYTLKHNIHEYLFRFKEESAVSSAVPEKPEKGDTPFKDVAKDKSAEKKEIPTAWRTLDERIGAVLGPHASFLEAFKANQGPDISKKQRIKRQSFNKETTSFSASRGLLPLDEVLELMYKHCFATYAVSCCGAARFSLVETLTRTGDSSTVDGILNSLEHLTKVGWLPPTETQMRRLRFAISMDQPSTLVRFTDLFDVDSRYGLPSHFHDEYLQLTLDAYMEHQEAWMNTILNFVIPVDDGYGVRNSDEIDMLVPFPIIRRAVLHVFHQLLQKPEQGNTLAKHFLLYCNLLREDENVRLGQFTDAPFFINAPPLSPAEAESKFAKIEKRRWPVEEESASCSLLHLSLAIRMTHIIWGSSSTPSARLAGLVLSSTASEQARGVELPGGHGTPSKGMRDGAFLNNVKEEFSDALLRVKTGVMQHNVLRHLAAEFTGAMREMEETPSPLDLTVDSKSALEASFHIRRLYAPWDDDQRRALPSRGSVPRGGRRSYTPRRMTSAFSGLNLQPETTVDRHYTPEVASLTRFLRLSRIGKSRGDKKRKSKSPRGFQETETIFLAPCASYETAYMSHQARLVRRLVEAASTPQPLPAVSAEETSAGPQLRTDSETAIASSCFAPAADRFNSIDSNIVEAAVAGAANISSMSTTDDSNIALPDVILDENGSTQKGKETIGGRNAVYQRHVSVRQLHAGCATLSLM